MRPGRHMRVVLRNAAREGKIYGTKKVGTNKTARRSWFWHLDDADLITVLRYCSTKIIWGYLTVAILLFKCALITVIVNCSHDQAANSCSCR